jgi:hypothetical protein
MVDKCVKSVDNFGKIKNGFTFSNISLKEDNEEEGWYSTKRTVFSHIQASSLLHMHTTIDLTYFFCYTRDMTVSEGGTLTIDTDR